jgi:hypothetical protein
MAQLIYRVTGRRGLERVFQTFRNTDEGRKAAAFLAAQLDSARTVYDVRTRIGGRVVTRTFKRRKDADAYTSTIEAEKLRGVVVEPRRAKVTVEDYTTGWLAHRSDRAVRTAELYRWLLDHQILPTFGATPLTDLSPSSVRSWHARIAAAHPTTAAKAYRLLSSIMRTAVADEVISRNPCQVKGAAVEKAPERPVASIAEVQALTNSMPEHLSVVVLLAAWCQLRRAELRGLRRRDVDLMRATLTVSVTRTTKMDGTTVEKAPKTDAGRRTIAIPRTSSLHSPTTFSATSSRSRTLCYSTARTVRSDSPGTKLGRLLVAPTSACTISGTPASHGRLLPGRASPS